jgi:preprotein translocase subunit SecA
MNEQRKVIYSQRREVLDGEDLEQKIRNMVHSLIREKVALYMSGEEQDIEGLVREFCPLLFNEEELSAYAAGTRNASAEEMEEEMLRRAQTLYDEKNTLMTDEVMREAERVILLRNVDRQWMDHIDAMDALEDGIRLQAYGQRDPVALYKIEGSNMFDEMIDEIRSNTVRQVLSVMPRTNIKRENVVKITGASHGGDATPVRHTPVKKSEAEKVGRNDPCPCGSGLKYKKCCGKAGGEE